MSVDQIDPADADFVARIEAEEVRATDIAIQHVLMYAPFKDLPDSFSTRLLADFKRMAATNTMTRAELIELLARDARRYTRKFRTTAMNNPGLLPVRIAVLVHVLLVIGEQALYQMDALWAALRASRWDEAHDELMMSNWPGYATSIEDRRLVLDLARMMRTGDVPPSWSK